MLDRLVGYKISPLLWDKVRRGLSAGRVQTVAVRVIVEREREIRAFIKQEYWTLDANLNAKKNPVLNARLFKRNDETPDITNEATANEIVADLDGRGLHRQVGRHARRRSAIRFRRSSPPRLQQESSRKLRFSVKRTMMLAQQLYEGVEIGAEGAVGLITYMRTDSTRVSDDAVDRSARLHHRTLRRSFCRPRPTSIKPKRTRRTRTKPSAPLPPCARRNRSKASWPKTSSSSTG